MLIVVTIMGLIAGISFPAVSSGIGEEVEELLLGDPALTRDVVRFTARVRVIRRQDGRIGSSIR